MNHPQIDYTERTGFPMIPYKSPSEHMLPSTLGRCQCGCGESITTDDAHIRWDDQYFLGSRHLIRFMAAHCGLEEVG